MTLVYVQRLLPGPLRSLIQQRLASTSTSANSQYEQLAYPFPPHPNPTPHEIFHLPCGASQNQIKARYYELVRIHHPDCPYARDLPPTTTHARFQAISNAYSILSGKKISNRAALDRDSDMAYHEEILRRKRAQWRGAAGSDEFGHSGPSLWELQRKEKFDQGALIFIILFVTSPSFFLWRIIIGLPLAFVCSLPPLEQALTAAILPVTLSSPFLVGRQRHEEASKNLADARREAKEVHQIRRLAMVQKDDRDVEDTGGSRGPDQEKSQG